jgi:hypothetical protein
MGLANHRKALHAEIAHYAHYAQRAREEQTKALTTVLERYGIEMSQLPAVVWTFFATGASQVLIFEPRIEMPLGHNEILKLLKDQIRTRGRTLPVDAPGSPVPD